MVALILAFVFAVPRDFFKDQPKAASVIMLPGGEFLIEPQLLNGVPDSDSERNAKAAQIIEARYKTRKTVTHVDPYFDSEHQLQGYAATVKP